MSDQDIVLNMINFVEQTERDIIAERLGKESKEKQRAVKEILKQLEKEIKNADQPT